MARMREVAERIGKQHDAPRPIWAGAISLGLVTVPVRLFPTVASYGVPFHQFVRGTNDRVRYLRVNERTGEEVNYADIVRGLELADEDGHVVMFESAELDELAPGQSHARTIDVIEFVDLDEIDRVYVQNSYWLTPAQTQNAKAYSLLVAAMAATNRAAIANIVMRGKQHLCAVRAVDGALALETLYYAEQVQHPSALTDLVEPAEPEGPELDMARSLILAMSTDWQPERYRDTYTEKVKQLVADKLAGDDMPAKSAPPEPTNVTDLLEALRRSVEARHAS